MEGIILVGGGGHCRSVIDAAESAGIPVAGILERAETEETDVLGYPVLGDDDLIENLAARHEFVVTVGFIRDNRIRERLHRRIKAAGGKLATVIASTARVSPHALIGEGSVVLHHASINACAKIGEGCIVNTAAIIEHDACIGEGCHVSTGAIINGGCRVGDGVFIGSGSILIQGVRIASGAIIGAGSLVRHDVESPGIIYGNI